MLGGGLFGEKKIAIKKTYFRLESENYFFSILVPNK